MLATRSKVGNSHIVLWEAEIRVGYFGTITTTSKPRSSQCWPWDKDRSNWRLPMSFDYLRGVGWCLQIHPFCLSLIFDICPNGESVNRGWAYQASIWDSAMGPSHSRTPRFGIQAVLSASLSSLDLSTISAIENRPFEGFLFECAERKRGWDNLGQRGQSWQLKADWGSSWIYTGHHLQRPNALFNSLAPCNESAPPWYGAED